MMNVWVATKNAHKVEELSEILAPAKVKSFLDLEQVPEVKETGLTYRENAEIKARALYELMKEPVIADDSGLEVDALNGAPGVNSARYGGVEGDHERNTQKLLAAMAKVPPQKRSARFRCLIVYIDQKGKSHEFEGKLEGQIATNLIGEGGFGYDPVFFLPERNCTVAQLESNEKNAISHRARAMQELKKFLATEPVNG
jgi:XTP/dITP diphosphohydrolase